MNISHLNKLVAFLLIIFIICTNSNVKAINDEIEPSSINVQSDYILNDTLMTVDDTLIITRTFINNEATPLTCFYYCDILPDDFSVVSHTVTINSSSVTYDYPTPTASSAFTNYTEYYWVLDYPGINGTYDLLVQPSATVVLQYKIVNTNVGVYDLPMHTFIGHNGTTGLFGYSDSLQVRFDVSLDIDERQELPNRFSLAQNYPNPFNPTTTIEFSLPEKSYVTLNVYNTLGQIVTNLVKEILPTGNHIVSWNGLSNNGSSAPSGVYFYKLITQDNNISKKMLLIK